MSSVLREILSDPEQKKLSSKRTFGAIAFLCAMFLYFSQGVVAIISSLMGVDMTDSLEEVRVGGHALLTFSAIALGFSLKLFKNGNGNGHK